MRRLGKITLLLCATAACLPTGPGGTDTGLTEITTVGQSSTTGDPDSDSDPSRGPGTTEAVTDLPVDASSSSTAWDACDGEPNAECCLIDPQSPACATCEAYDICVADALEEFTADLDACDAEHGPPASSCAAWFCWLAARSEYWTRVINVCMQQVGPDDGCEIDVAAECRLACDWMAEVECFPLCTEGTDPAICNGPHSECDERCLAAY